MPMQSDPQIHHHHTELRKLITRQQSELSYAVGKCKELQQKPKEPPDGVCVCMLINVRPTVTNQNK